ncbi:MAG TPA: hypothetical protein VNZ49_11200 [Bacteroidia bacterium]|jgi:hypothetical protein|nr:hypothetical protein [Bacteroidia bacterium]
MKYIFLFSIFILFSCSNRNQAESVTENSELINNNDVTKIIRKRKAVNDSIRKEKADDQRYIDAFLLKSYWVPISKDQEITVIKSSCAVFINPTDEQIEQMKKEDGEENFSTIADDQMYYTYEAQNFFKENKIDCLSPATRYLKFVTPDSEFVVDTRAKVSYGWLTILFNSDSLPKILTPIDMPRVFKTYFPQ